METNLKCFRKQKNQIKLNSKGEKNPQKRWSNYAMTLNIRAGLQVVNRG